MSTKYSASLSSPHLLDLGKPKAAIESIEPKNVKISSGIEGSAAHVEEI